MLKPEHIAPGTPVAGYRWSNIDTSTPCAFIMISTGYDMTFESNAAPRTMSCTAAGKYR